MQITQLEKFRGLYAKGHTNVSGASRVFNEFFGLPRNNLVPLSLSHGVDFGHCRSAMDVDRIEPIHWCYNESLYTRASVLKPSIQMPHPWLMLKALKVVPHGTRTLAIGPPPSPENDLRLLKLLERRGTTDVTILIKKRGNYKGSIDFWQSRGIDTISAQDQPGAFYNSLFELLSAFQSVISGTFSSALIFAAAINKEVELLENYSYHSYFPIDYLNTVDFRSNHAISAVNVFCDGTTAEKKTFSLELLGSRFIHDEANLLTDLRNVIAGLKLGCHGLGRSPSMVKRVLFDFAVWLERPGIARFDRSVAEKLVGVRKVLDIDIDETSIWRNGLHSSNFKAKEAKFIAGNTEPGTAVSQYPSNGRE